MSLGVLFDIDGTLVTFTFDVQGTRKALLELVSREGFDTTGLALTSPTQRIMDAVREQAASGRVAVGYASIRKRMYAILDRFELESCNSAAIFPGTAETLKLLRERSAKLAVLTNSGRRAAGEILGHHSLEGFFDFVLTRDDVDAMKPNPEGLALAISMFSLPRDRVVYVGDSLYDILAAKAAGLKVVSVATGSYTAERLKSEGADIVIDSLTALPSVLLL